MKKRSIILLLFLTTFLLLAPTQSGATNNNEWLRYPAISPNGKFIAFEAQGDIYIVNAEGGEAKNITQNPNYQYKPLWSPNNEYIAYASYEFGYSEIFIYSLKTQEHKRLTFYSFDKEPYSFTPDGKSILFKTYIQHNHKTAKISDWVFHQLYSISTDGKHLKQILDQSAEEARYSKNQQFLVFQDKKGYEDTWRKHQISPVARDVWLWNIKSNNFEKLTNFEGDDREPWFSSDQNSIFFLSERGTGNFNIYEYNIDSKKISEITNHPTHPVRHLSVSENDQLCYSYNGSIFVKKKNIQTKKINISIPKIPEQLVDTIEFSGNATEIAVSPTTNEYAFVYRGEIYVAKTDTSLTRQITHTPEQERSVSFSSDGKMLIYASERNGSWNIYTSEINNSEHSFFEATKIEEKTLLADNQTSFQPILSPDKSKLAFITNNTSVKVLDLKTKQQKLLFDGQNHYSYADGDQHIQWASNSKYLVYAPQNNLFLSDVFFLDIEKTNQSVNISNSGFNDIKPFFSSDSKQIFWISDKFGMRHTADWWGVLSHVYAFSLNLQEHNFFTQKDSISSENENFESENIDQRIIQFNKRAGMIRDFKISADKNNLYTLERSELGFELWHFNNKDNETELLSIFDAYNPSVSMWKNKSDGSSLHFSSDESLLYVFIDDKIFEYNISTKTKIQLKYSGKYVVNKSDEYRYLFDHMYHQVARKFYKKDLHGVNWPAMYKNYQPKIENITNDFDFSEMASEMMGELNASHTGFKHYPSRKKAEFSGTLECYISFVPNKKGVVIDDIPEGSVLDLYKDKISAGDIISRINDIKITDPADYFAALYGQLAKKVTIKFYHAGSKKQTEIKLKTGGIGSQKNIMHKNWVKHNETTVLKLSDGKLGYIYVSSMSDNVYREVYSLLKGKYKDKEAIVLDTRSNGGGWLHDNLITLLSGKKYFEYNVRGTSLGYEPYTKWYKPSIVLVSEDNYSDAYGFPFGYQALGIGKIVGTKVAGTMTAVWWEDQINDHFTIGIPQVGTIDLQGNFNENKTLIPDVEIHNSPKDELSGNDRQLKKAVELLMNQLTIK